MDHASHFGDLRSLLQRRRRLGQMPALMALLGQLGQDEDALRVALDYAEQHLRAWPDEARRALRDDLEDWPRRAAQRLTRSIVWTGELGPLRRWLDAGQEPIAALSLRNPDRELAAVLAHERVRASLRALHLTRMGELTQPHLEALSPLSPLRELAVDHVASTPEQLRALLDLPCAMRLERLSLQAYRPLAQAVSWLGHHPHLSQLQALAIGLNPLSAQDALALGAGTSLRQLRWLSLWGCELTDQELGALLAPGHLPQLTDLNLGGNPLSSRVIEVLLRADCFDQLRALWLWGAARPTLRALGRLLNTRQRGALRALNFNGVGLSADHLSVLGRSPGAAHLEHLQLYQCELTTAHVQALFELGQLLALRELDLRGNEELTAESLRALEAAPALSSLSLAETALSTEEIAAFLSSQAAPALRSLELSSTNTDLDVLRAHARAQPHRPDDLICTTLDIRQDEEGPFDDFKTMDAEQPLVSAAQVSATQA